VIFDPTALPKARPPFPSRAAISDTIISGAEVPKPIMKMPMRMGDTPK